MEEDTKETTVTNAEVVASAEVAMEDTKCTPSAARAAPVVVELGTTMLEECNILSTKCKINIISNIVLARADSAMALHPPISTDQPNATERNKYRRTPSPSVRRMAHVYPPPDFHIC